MSSSELTAIEAAAFASWPALDGEQDYCGWRLRYGGGYTKRANSANATAASMALTDAQIDEIEGRYRQRGLPPIFRLLSQTLPDGTDAALERRGYRCLDRSLVMSLPLQPRHAGPLPTMLADAAEWLAEFAGRSGIASAGDDLHLRLLRAIEAESAFALERRDGKAACFALGVLADGRLGLFDVATAPGSRRQGLAAGLCTQLLAWGYERGASSAYLQVVAANVPAIAMYRKLGFGEAYHYWYRVKD